MSVSADSKDFLADAKQGKARKFVMLVQGTTITSLTVYKKGNATKLVQEAKKEGNKGLPYHGLITGKGMDLTFQLAVVDGFDKKPVKDTILKKYLEEEADFKCLPMFEIVQTQGMALDPDDPLHARFLKIQPKALHACEVHPTTAQPITALCTKIGALLDEDQRDAATKEITELEKLLSGLAEVPVAPQSSADLALDFTNRLKVLKPDIDKVLATGSAVSERLKTLTGEAGTAARNKSFAEALQLLDQIEPLVRQGLRDVTSDPSAPEDPAAYNNRLKSLLPRVKEASASDAALAQQLKTLATDAAAAIQQAKYDDAKRLLDRIEQAVLEKEDQGKRISPKFAQQWEEAKAQWQTALDDVNTQMERLRGALLKEEDEELKRIAEFGLNAITADHRTPLQASIMDLDRAPDDKKAKFIRQTSELVQDFRDHIETDDQVEECDDNPFEVPVSIRGTLEPALAKMSQALEQAFAP